MYDLTQREITLSKAWAFTHEKDDWKTEFEIEKESINILLDVTLLK